MTHIFILSTYSIGSLGERGSTATVRGIHTRNCTFIGSQNGARIKTWQVKFIIETLNFHCDWIQ